MSDFIKEYNLSLGNEIFKIKLTKANNGEDNSILLTANNKENNILYYQGIFSLDNLMSLSKAFRFCDNINEALNIISKIFDSKKCGLTQDNNNKENLSLYLKINLPSGDEQEINLNLNKIEDIENASKKELIEKIKELEEENLRLKNEINKLKKENSKKDNIIKSLSNNKNNQIEAKEEEINYLKNEEEELDENTINTSIIKNDDELNFIENRLRQIPYFKNKSLKYELLYKGTKNGDKSLNFHIRVDGIKNTLTLVKTKKGIRLGGFTSEIWNQIGGYGKCDSLAFCFSLELRKIYNSQKNQLAIFCSDGYGPYFKGTNTIFGVYNNFLSQGGWCDYTTYSYSFGKFEKNFEITNGEQKFEIEDVEVFKVYAD